MLGKVLYNKAFFAPILERAERYGVNILVENFNIIAFNILLGLVSNLSY